MNFKNLLSRVLVSDFISKKIVSHSIIRWKYRKWIDNTILVFHFKIIKLIGTTCLLLQSSLALSSNHLRHIQPAGNDQHGDDTGDQYHWSMIMTKKAYITFIWLTFWKLTPVIKNIAFYQRTKCTLYFFNLSSHHDTDGENSSECDEKDPLHNCFQIEWILEISQYGNGLNSDFIQHSSSFSLIRLHFIGRRLG